jgi:hypothetical protein
MALQAVNPATGARLAAHEETPLDEVWNIIDKTPKAYRDGVAVSHDDP